MTRRPAAPGSHRSRVSPNDCKTQHASRFGPKTKRDECVLGARCSGLGREKRKNAARWRRDVDLDCVGNGAQERTRTSTSIRTLAPEASASTNSATWAGVRSAVGKEAGAACQRLCVHDATGSAALILVSFVQTVVACHRRLRCGAKMRDVDEMLLAFPANDPGSSIAGLCPTR